MEIKNRTYYFYDGMINLKNFQSNLLKIDKKIIQKHWHLQHSLHTN